MIIEDRMEKMERELARATRDNRRLLAGLIIVFGLAVTVWILAPGMTILAGHRAPKEIHSTKFILEDANGKSRAELGMTEDGPVFRLKDQNGKDRALLYIHDKVGLTLNDENGKTRLALGVIQNAPCLFFFDTNDESRISLTVLKEGPFLGLYDEKHQRLPIR